MDLGPGRQTGEQMSLPDVAAAAPVVRRNGGQPQDSGHVRDGNPPIGPSACPVTSRPVPKGKSTTDDLAVRLDWPHAGAPLALDRGSAPPQRANGPTASGPSANGPDRNDRDGEPPGLALVVQRLDALIAQVQALSEQVEALARRSAPRPEEAKAAPPARRAAPRRRPTEISPE